MIEEESKVNHSDKKKMTGRFNITSSEKKQEDDSIIRILPGLPRASVKEIEDIYPVLNAIQLTKLEPILD
jgi:hypothetical protein